MTIYACYIQYSSDNENETSSIEIKWNENDYSDGCEHVYCDWKVVCCDTLLFSPSLKLSAPYAMVAILLVYIWQERF